MATTVTPAHTVGQNVTVSYNADGTVSLTFDPKVNLGPSASGKTFLVAKTGGNVTLANGVTVGLNVYRK
jgi:uncharacterized lipoprotein NlpE involved in copper resistance